MGNSNVCRWFGDNADSGNAIDFLALGSNFKWLSDDIWNHWNRFDGSIDEFNFISNAEKEKVTCCYYGGDTQ